MGRWACVDLPALPLQLLLQREPEWSAHPAAVIDRDSPTGKLLAVNERARQRTILPGMRYAAALALANDLRAAVVPPEEVERGIDRLTRKLREFSPAVEPNEEEPGVFWLDAEGLARLWPSASDWGRALHATIASAGFEAHVVVGFTRYGSYAVSKARRAPVVVFRAPEDEQHAARAVPLSRLGLPADLRDDLRKLGIETIGGLLDLPHAAVHDRFGAAAGGPQRLAADRAFAPLQPFLPAERCAERRELEFAEDDVTRLLFTLKGMLDPRLAQIAARHEAIAALTLRLWLDTPGGRTLREESLKPAKPTGDAPLLLDLIRLRLESGPLAGKIEEVEVELCCVKTHALQLGLFVTAPRRDRDAASRALARLAAEFGAEAVARARLREGHLPEASFVWEPMQQFDPPRDTLPEPRPSEPVLIRRLFKSPKPLPPQEHHLRDDGWMIHSYEQGTVVKLTGPYVVSGGWWARFVHREYHFAETQRGDLLWVYYDRPRRQWFLHGEVS